LAATVAEVALIDSLHISRSLPASLYRFPLLFNGLLPLQYIMIEDESIHAGGFVPLHEQQASSIQR
jgi:hypothetical protein